MPDTAQAFAGLDVFFEQCKRLAVRVGDATGDDGVNTGAADAVATAIRQRYVLPSSSCQDSFTRLGVEVSVGVAQGNIVDHTHSLQRPGYLENDPAHGSHQFYNVILSLPGNEAYTCHRSKYFQA